MLIRSHKLNPWNRTALGCMMGITLSLGWLFVALDSQDYVTFSPYWFLLGPVMTLLLLLCGALLGPPERLKYFALLLGVGHLSLCLLVLAPVIVVLAISWTDAHTRLVLTALFVVATLSWSALKISRAKAMLKRHSYLTKELKPAESGSYSIDGDRAEDAGNLSGQKPSSTASQQWMATKLPFFIAMSMALYRLMADFGGPMLVHEFLALLCMPLFIYGAGRLSAGFYLWVVAIHRFEVEHRAKVYLRNSG